MVKVKKESIFLFILATLLILAATLRPPGIDRDSLTYIDMINRPIAELWFQEPTFILLVSINKYIFNNSYIIFFFSYALLGVSLKIIAISKIDKYKWFGVFTYLFLYFTLHDLTQIRAGVASGFFLLSIYYIDKSKSKAFVFSLLSVIFHYSAILGFIIYCFSTKKINKLFYVILVIVSLLISILLSQDIIVTIASYLPDFLSHKVNTYVYLLNNSGQWSEINQFNLYYLSLIYIFLVQLYFTKNVKSNEKFNNSKGYSDIVILKTMMLMIVSYYILVPIPVLAGRVSEFYGIVLICFIPQFLSNFRKNKYIILPILFLVVIISYRGLRLNYEILFEELLKRI
ncbi:EpsG family protein [Providencia rettgeri]|uniref:EpsG family protein n=1 Tax=Providencia sp. PROV200 TaxID=2936794 RepID=UPI001BD67103|nr:EpsG family protein [Providencia rettgeri]